VTKEETALQIAKLADDGFEATLDVFKNISTETVQLFGDIKIIRRYGSAIKAFEALMETIRAFEHMNTEADVENEFVSESVIDSLYPAVPMVKEGRVVTGPEYSFTGGKAQIVGEKVQRTYSPPSLALKCLAWLAKKYRIVSILAKQFEKDDEVYNNLIRAAYSLQEQYDDAKLWAQTYQNEFKPLEERNHLTDIFPKLAAAKREISEGEKTEVRKRDDTTRVMPAGIR